VIPLQYLAPLNASCIARSDTHLTNFNNYAIASMPPSQYPRATVKKIVKAHSKRPLTKNVDIMVCLHLYPYIHAPRRLLFKNLLADGQITYTDMAQLHAIHARVRPSTHTHTHTHTHTPLSSLHRARLDLHSTVLHVIPRDYTPRTHNVLRRQHALQTSEQGRRSQADDWKTSLMREATIKARRSGEKQISATTVRKVREVRIIPPQCCPHDSPASERGSKTDCIGL